jgi:hypothetical protein
MNPTQLERLQMELKRLISGVNMNDGKLVITSVFYLWYVVQNVETMSMADCCRCYTCAGGRGRPRPGAQLARLATVWRVRPTWGLRRRQQVAVAATVRIARSSRRRHATRGTRAVHWPGASVARHRRSCGEVTGGQPTRARAGLAENTNKEAGHGPAHRKRGRWIRETKKQALICDKERMTA